MRSKPILLFSVLVFSLFLVLYHQASAATSQVNVGQSGNNFTPATLTITRGDTVNWVWVSGFHNVTSGGCPGGICSSDGKFNSGAPNAPPRTFSVTFNTSGAFPYFCSVHGSSMQGTIVVQDPPTEVPEADSLALILTGGVGLASYLALKWRGRKRTC